MGADGKSACHHALPASMLTCAARTGRRGACLPLMRSLPGCPAGARL